MKLMKCASSSHGAHSFRLMCLLLPLLNVRKGEGHCSPNIAGDEISLLVSLPRFLLSLLVVEEGGCTICQSNSSSKVSTCESSGVLLTMVPPSAAAGTLAARSPLRSPPRSFPRKKAVEKAVN